MFRKITKKILTLIAALNIVILSACSSVSNLTPQKVTESESGTYTLTMAAKIKDPNAIRGSEKPYVIIEGEKYLMQNALNLRDEVMYQYNYTFPKDKKSVQYYYIIEYKAKRNGDRVIYTKELHGEEIFVLKPLTTLVSEIQLKSGTIGTVVPIQGMGFEDGDVVLIGGKEAETACLSKNTLEFIVPALEAKKRYDVEIKQKDGSTLWAGAFYLKAAELMVSPTKIEKESGQVINMIFDIGFVAPKGGYYIDVQTNIPSSVIMPEVFVEEGESAVAIPIKFAASGRGALFINALGFNECVVQTDVEAIVPVEVDLINSQPDEISENILMPAPIEDTQDVEEIEEVIIIEAKE